MSYKRIIIKDFGGPEVLEMVEDPHLPSPAAGEVRVRVLHTCANFTDVMIRKGKYPDVKEKPPFSPGYDMVGIVDETGEGVSGLEPGQKVADMTVTGAYSEYLCLPAERLIPVPEDLEPAKAVCLVLSYVTAYQMMHRKTGLREGQRILVHGAGGAVGVALLQLGKLLNLEMYGTASASKRDIVTTHGATHIDYEKEDFVQQLKKLAPGGLDAVFDPFGGAHFKRSFRTLRKGGMLVAYGFYNAVMGFGGSVPLDYMKVLFWNVWPNGRHARFYSIGPLRKRRPEWYRKDLAVLLSMLAQKKIEPHIAALVPLEDAAEAHRRIEQAPPAGKIVFRCS